MKNVSKKQNERFLGFRKVSLMNFSKIVTLPKDFTKFLDEDRFVKMTIEENTLKITPIRVPQDKEGDE